MASKVQQRECLSGTVLIQTNGGLRNISGTFEVISKRHLYNWIVGIDIYPSVEQVASLRRGESITLGMDNWA